LVWWEIAALRKGKAFTAFFDLVTLYVCGGGGWREGSYIISYDMICGVRPEQEFGQSSQRERTYFSSVLVQIVP
jgi:hypothetical protein